MAYAVLGDRKAGMASLERAAKRSRRKISDWEFADVLDVLTGKSQFG